MDNIAKALGLEPIDVDIDIDIDKLFKEHGLQNFDSMISKEECIKRNSEIVNCDRCNVSGNRPNMIRWHFENCKTVIRKCEYCNNNIPRQGIKDSQYNDKKYCNRKCYMQSKKGLLAINMTPEVKEKLSIYGKSQSSIRSERLKKNKPWEARWGFKCD